MPKLTWLCRHHRFGTMAGLAAHTILGQHVRDDAAFDRWTSLLDPAMAGLNPVVA
jgi:hypothetical protein